MRPPGGNARWIVEIATLVSAAALLDYLAIQFCLMSGRMYLAMGLAPEPFHPFAFSEQWIFSVLSDFGE